MTTNHDILIEQLSDALIAMKVQELLTEQEFRNLHETLVAEVNYSVVERKVNKKQENWNLNTSFLYR